jgi:hypothetical protein
MTGGTLGSRLTRIEATARVRIVERLSGPAMLVVDPDDWPSEEVAAFDSDDPHVRANVIERQVGVRPGPATRIIAIQVRQDGPA